MIETVDGNISFATSPALGNTMAIVGFVAQWQQPCPVVEMKKGDLPKEA
jgi:hypothetical protein